MMDDFNSLPSYVMNNIKYNKTIFSCIYFGFSRFENIGNNARIVTAIANNFSWFEMEIEHKKSVIFL